MTKSNILGIGINFDINYSEVIFRCIDFISSRKKSYVVTVNPEFLVDAQSDTLFASILNNADIATPDGVGVIIARDVLDRKKLLPRLHTLLAAIFIGERYAKKRITGVELTKLLLAECDKRCLSVVLLGGSLDTSFHSEGISGALAEIVHKKYPNINLVCYSSEFDSPRQDLASVSFINEKISSSGLERADVVFVAYGHPKQEKWIYNNIKNVNGTLFIGVGGTFDFLVGKRRRSPDFYIKYNIEWLYRLLQQPSRFKRIYKAVVQFSLLLLVK